MKLLYQNESGSKVSKTLFTNVLKRLSFVLAPPLSYENVELLLTDNDTIQSLNKEYRGKDYATDVLSFPFNDDTSTLGQIVISLDKAREQAVELQQSLEEELSFLFAHGLLHLFGFDHETPIEEEIMLEKTYKLLNRKQRP